MRVELQGVRHWRHDLTGCLHCAAAVLLHFCGAAPLEVLGAAWWFRYPNDLRREEYYLPGAGESLLSGLAPYHPVTSCWHEPVDAAAGWQEVRARVAAGVPVAVAADNFHLPFRPAYTDVHTNHLIVVYGFDDAQDEALVIDSVPPRFQGPISVRQLSAARDSSNEVRHERDLYFTANPIRNRWLDIEVGNDLPAFDPEFVRYVIAANADAFVRDDAGHAGLAGERQFLQRVAQRLAAGSAEAIDEAFVVAGPMLAITALHAEWLGLAASRFERYRLAEAARAVDRVAHHWSALRILVATARPDPPAAAPAVFRRAGRLQEDHLRALDLLDRAAREC